MLTFIWVLALPLTMRLGASHFTSTSLSFLSYKMGKWFVRMYVKHFSISVPYILQVLIIIVANRPRTVCKAVYTHYLYLILSATRTGAEEITEQTPAACLVSSLRSVSFPIECHFYFFVTALIPFQNTFHIILHNDFCLHHIGQTSNCKGGWEI